MDVVYGGRQNEQHRGVLSPRCLFGYIFRCL